MFNEHEQVVLISDIEAKGLMAGDVGTIVHVHPEGQAYVVEFMSLGGDTLAVATVLPGQARPVTSLDITHARMVATS